MRYPMRFLQRVGLASTLLIGGVLGGLMAPPPSEAGTPQLTLKIDDLPLTSTTGTTDTTVQGNSILGSTTPSTCSTADQGLGYTACYSIVTSTTTAYVGRPASDGTRRLYRIQNAPNQTARLRVGDNAGLDNLSIAGVQLVPVTTANQSATALTNWGSSSANTTEEHKLVMTMTYTFDSLVNSTNAGLTAVAMRAGGEFRAGPLSTPIPTTTLYCVTPAGTTAAKCDTVGDKIEYSGVGTFSSTIQGVALLNPSGSPTNSQPLSLTVGSGSTGKSPVSFGTLPYSNANMAMIDPAYPKFDCRSASRPTACTQTATQTMTVTLKGPDSFVATGDDIHIAGCAAQDTSRLQRLVTNITLGVALLDPIAQSTQNKFLLDLVAAAKAFLLTASVPADPDCAGGIVARAAMINDGVADALQHLRTGAVPAVPAPTGTITINKHLDIVCVGEICPIDSQTFSFLITGFGGPVTVVTAAGTVGVGNAGNGSTVVTVPAASFPGDLAGTYAVSELTKDGWTQVSNSCGPVPPMTIEVPPGGNVTCNFVNSKTPTTGTITITKYIPSCGELCSANGTVFDYDVTGPASRAISITVNGAYTSTTLMNMPPGTYSIVEAPKFGWSYASYCTNGVAVGFVVQNDNVTCTFTSSEIIN